MATFYRVPFALEVSGIAGREQLGTQGLQRWRNMGRATETEQELKIRAYCYLIKTLYK